MALMEQKKCTCRNCGHQQQVVYYNSVTPDPTRACATCDSCGFGSIWFDIELNTELWEHSAKEQLEALKKPKPEPMPRKIGELYKRYADGESLSDAEIIRLRDAFEKAYEACGALGPRFYLPCTEAHKQFDRLRDICKARGI